MFCSQCGKEIADNSKFCPESGKPIDSIEQNIDMVIYDSIDKEASNSNNEGEKHKVHFLSKYILGSLIFLFIILSLFFLAPFYLGFLSFL